ncbi:hypothetical protein Nepgr_005342 [Nepenthes gracilis]|uniref:Uncharacterized protein n=1 Tax=Nepenthes gracilis TaxID=150966 RepID=A0AAD3S341_NEPGR|nr:hypothetical protein Nepgr_005342 [Nepenthes gracilis]
MPAQLIDSVPIQTTYATCSSVSVGDVSEDDGALSGSMNDELANVVTNSDHPVLDVGAPFVADHVAGSPHRPLTTLDYVPIEDGSMGALQASIAGLVAVSNHHNQIDGSNGVAISDEFGLIPGVDDSTLESIARITRKYSLVDVVDGLLIKAPSKFQDVSSIPLSGCPVEGSEASVAVAVQPCDLERGLVHALPNVDPSAGDPLARAISSFSDDKGILQCPDLHLPCCSKATRVPVGPSSGSVAAVQGLLPCNPSDSSSCHLEPHAHWNEDELSARQAINGWERMAQRRKSAPKKTHFPKK